MPPRVRSPSAAKPPPSIVLDRTSLTFVCCWIMGICSIPSSWPQPSFNSLLQNHPRHSTAIDAVSRKILTLRAKQNPECLNNPRNCQARSCQSEWPLAEKGATRWWSLDPMELHATLRREHLQSSQSSVEFFIVSHGTLNSAWNKSELPHSACVFLQHAMRNCL